MRAVELLIVLIKSRLEAFIEKYACSPFIEITLFDQEYFYEKMDSSTELLAELPKDDELDSEYYVYKTRDLLIRLMPFFHKNLRIATHRNRIYVPARVPAPSEEDGFSRSLDLFRIMHHGTHRQKTSIFIEGILFGRPDRTYGIHFLNDYEYTAHIYENNRLSRFLVKTL